MRITFVRPNMHAGRSKDAMQPLAFANLAGLTPPDVERVLVDERLEEIPFDEPTDLVAITVETYTARRSYAIAAGFRARGVPVVMGGYHPTFLPEEVLQHCDSVVLGDAEGVWKTVVEDARRGVLQPRYEQSGFPDLAGHFPDRSIFDGKKYLPMSLVQYARGCKYNCDFCSIRAFYGSSLRQRPVREVVREIEEAGHKNVFFVDDNIFVDVAKAREFFEAIIPLKIRWSCQVSIDMAKEPGLLDLMQKSGCTAAVVGFESLNIDNLRQMRKKWNLKHGPYSESIAAFQDAGVMIYGTFVFGYDHDTVDDFERAAEFSIEHRFYLANFNPLAPTPRAPLHDRLVKEGRLLHEKWWLAPGYCYGQATFRPRGMTADELTEGCYRARSLFNTYGSIGRRLGAGPNLRSPYRMGLYLLSNLISRKEIHAKQGVELGGLLEGAAAK